MGRLPFTPRQEQIALEISLEEDDFSTRFHSMRWETCPDFLPPQYQLTFLEAWHDYFGT